MQLTRFLVSLGLVACSSPTTGSPPDAAPDAPAPDAAVVPDAAVAPVTLTMGSFNVPAGSEVYYCQNFANPLGLDFDVSEFASTGTDGATWSTYLFDKPDATDGDVAPCSGLELSALRYANRGVEGDLVYPAGVGAHVAATDGFRLSVHAVNTTAADVLATHAVTLHVASPSTVTQQAGMMFAVDSQFAVPSDTTATLTHDCTVAQQLHVIASSGITFRNATFAVSVDGAPLVPPAVVAAGSAIHFECVVTNPSPTATLHFGESALTDQQCTWFAPFYAIANGAPATIDCPGTNAQH